MKKALTITLTLILGFGANFLAVPGLIALGLYVTGDTPIWLAAVIAVIAALTALLHFVRKRLTKYVHGTVIILCAQLPSILFWAFTFAADSIAVIFPSAIIMIAAFVVWALKDKIKKWWSEP